VRWYDIKSWALQYVALSHDAAHVHLGLVLFLGVLWILRRQPRRLAMAWAATLVATLINEALDGYDWILWTGTINWTESLKDIANTMAWPTIVCLLAMPRQQGSFLSNFLAKVR